jgi:hypothetical protein
MTPPASRRAFARVPVRVARLDRVRVLRQYALCRDARHVVYFGENGDWYEAGANDVYLSTDEACEVREMHREWLAELKGEPRHDE